MNLVLNYEGFEKYLFETEHIHRGVHYVFRFQNGYGASVIKHPYSYGHEEDLWELAVIEHCDDGKWHIVYETPITDDVIGYQTDEEIVELLQSIKEL